MPALAFSQTARSSLPGSHVGQIALEQAVADASGADRPRAWSPSRPRRRRRARRAAPAPSGVGRQIASRYDDADVDRPERRRERGERDSPRTARPRPGAGRGTCRSTPPSIAQPARSGPSVASIRRLGRPDREVGAVAERAVVAEHGAERLLEPSLRQVKAKIEAVKAEDQRRLERRVGSVRHRGRRRRCRARRWRRRRRPSSRCAGVPPSSRSW